MCPYFAFFDLVDFDVANDALSIFLPSNLVATEIASAIIFGDDITMWMAISRYAKLRRFFMRPGSIQSNFNLRARLSFVLANWLNGIVNSVAPVIAFLVIPGMYYLHQVAPETM